MLDACLIIAAHPLTLVFLALSGAVAAIGSAPGRTVRLRRALVVLAVAGAGMLAQGSWARADLLPLPPVQVAEWQAIGRLNIAGYNRRSMCSAVLVAPDRVLTAAHCLYRGAARARLDDLHFVAGWSAQGHAGHGRVAEAEIAPGFDMGLAGAPDIAVLRLRAPLAPTPLPVARAAPDAALAIAGYQDTRPHEMGGQFGCVRQSDTEISGCPVRPGTSGAPVLLWQADRWHVAGVVSARSGAVTVFAPVSDWVLERLAAP